MKVILIFFKKSNYIQKLKKGYCKGNFEFDGSKISPQKSRTQPCLPLCIITSSSKNSL